MARATSVARKWCRTPNRTFTQVRWRNSKHIVLEKCMLVCKLKAHNNGESTGIIYGVCELYLSMFWPLKVLWPLSVDQNNPFLKHDPLNVLSSIVLHHISGWSLGNNPYTHTETPSACSMVRRHPSRNCHLIFIQSGRFFQYICCRQTFYRMLGGSKHHTTIVSCS